METTAPVTRKQPIKESYVSAWVPQASKRKLRALAVLQGVTVSAALRGLIDAAPLEAHNAAPGNRLDVG